MAFLRHLSKFGIASAAMLIATTANPAAAAAADDCVFINDAITTCDFAEMGLSFSFAEDKSWLRSILNVSTDWLSSTDCLPPFEEDLPAAYTDDAANNADGNVCSECQATLNEAGAGLMNPLAMNKLETVTACKDACNARAYFADWATYIVPAPWPADGPAMPMQTTPYAGITRTQCMPPTATDVGTAMGGSMSMMAMLFDPVQGNINQDDYLKHYGDVVFSLHVTYENQTVADAGALGFRVNADTGEVKVAPKSSRTDEPRSFRVYTVELVATDYAETKYPVRTWTAVVVPRPDYIVNKAARKDQAMKGVEYIDPHSTDILAVNASVHIAGPNIIGYNASTANTCNGMLNGGSYVLKVEPDAPGWFIKSDTGEVFGKFRPADNGTTFTFKVFAVDKFDPSYANALVEKFKIEARYRDTHDTANGPGGHGCNLKGTNKTVDKFPFDNEFSCTCHDGWLGDTCSVNDELQQATAAAAASEAAAAQAAATAAVLTAASQAAAAKNAADDKITRQKLGGSLGGVIVAILIVLGAVQYRKHQLSMVATDFKLELEKFKEEGLIDADSIEGGALVPKELKRGGIEITEKIGEGQFGEVAKGTIDMAIATGIKGIPPYAVAIKTVHDSTNEGAIELVREAAVMAQVPDNKHLVSIIGVVTRGLPMMLVAQFCEHGSLLDVLRKYADGYGPLLKRPKSAEWMGFEIASGMQHLASKHFIHRDLAARNVLVDGSMTCKVADFGLSRGATSVSDGDEGYYKSTNGVFPLRWTSPESMQTLKFSSASDVWGFAIVIVEVLQNGRIPYSGMSNREVILDVMKGYRIEQKFLPGCSNGLYNVLRRCWDIKPEERPNFTQLVAEFEGLTEGKGDNGTVEVAAEVLPEGYAGPTGDESEVTYYDADGSASALANCANDTAMQDATGNNYDSYVATNGGQQPANPEAAYVGETDSTLATSYVPLSTTNAARDDAAGTLYKTAEEAAAAGGVYHTAERAAAEDTGYMECGGSATPQPGDESVTTPNSYEYLSSEQVRRTSLNSDAFHQVIAEANSINNTPQDGYLTPATLPVAELGSRNSVKSKTKKPGTESELNVDEDGYVEGSTIPDILAGGKVPPLPTTKRPSFGF